MDLTPIVTTVTAHPALVVVVDPIAVKAVNCVTTINTIVTPLSIVLGNNVATTNIVVEAPKVAVLILSTEFQFLIVLAIQAIANGIGTTPTMKTNGELTVTLLVDTVLHLLLVSEMNGSILAFQAVSPLVVLQVITLLGQVLLISTTSSQLKELIVL